MAMRAIEHVGVHSLQTTVEVGTLLSVSEYLFDTDGDGIIGEIHTANDSNFTVNLTEEGRYKPRVTIRTENDLLYSSGSYALSLDVKADENQTDPIGAQPIDVAKEFVEAIISNDRESVEIILMHSKQWIEMLYSNDQRRKVIKEKLKHINNDSWIQTYHSNGAATVTAVIYDDKLKQEFPIGFELTPAGSTYNVSSGRFWFIRAFY